MGEWVMRGGAGNWALVLSNGHTFLTLEIYIGNSSK